MPTELEAVFTRRRKAQAQSDAHKTLLLICVAIALLVVVLLFESRNFAQAVELMGELEF